MQQALPYRNWLTNSTATEITKSSHSVMRKLVSENAVVVFARRGCCMCHVVKLLLNGHGVNPFVFDIDEENESDVISELCEISGSAVAPPSPTVFIGGKLVGGLEELMGAHISGDLVPRLRDARALWL